MRYVGGIAAILVVLVTLGPIAAVFSLGWGEGVLRSADYAAIRFSVFQASLSALLSVALAMPLSRALARRRFWGRGALIAILGAPFILPTLVAVLGLIAVFGKSGWVSMLLGYFGFDPIGIYGLHGILLAHVFFNLPFATRMLLQGWAAIPAEQFRVAANLGFGPMRTFWVIEWPMLRVRVLPVLLVIFVICLSSFAVALTLGGGPKATTVELAIYQAFRFDFDLTRAAILGVAQVMMVSFASIVMLQIEPRRGLGIGRDRDLRRFDCTPLSMRLWDSAVIVVATMFLVVPVVAVLWRGIGAMTNLPQSVWSAVVTSTIVACGAVIVALVLAIPLATRRYGDWVALTGIAVSPLVMGIGLFVMARPFVAPTQLAIPMTILVNAVISLPFVLRGLRSAFVEVEAGYGRLGAALGLTGWRWWRWVVLPRLRPAIGFGAGLTAAFSIGDLGVISLFNDGQTVTLPMQIYSLMGAYRMEAASGAAVVLVAIAFGAYAAFDYWGRYAER